ncbi:hypothetical protein TWF730_007025 [Orbilia blumenaviensis]|uniref:Uncharacterized protein n=1 Tax=Orbilia blumenaviensis TaxID=1796055 RepID=A0AAV9VM92_9PEZI
MPCGRGARRLTTISGRLRRLGLQDESVHGGGRVEGAEGGYDSAADSDYEGEGEGEEEEEGEEANNAEDEADVVETAINDIKESDLEEPLRRTAGRSRYSDF